MVYSKPPFGGPEQVLAYLGRYTHRVAISHERLLDLNDGTVRFRYRDYARGNLLHVVPPGLMRIRHVGLLANRCRTGAPGPLPGAARPPEPPPGEPEPVQAAMLRLTGIGIQRCPYCAEGHLQRIVLVVPLRAAPPYSESDRTPTALMTTITRRSPRPLPRKPATVPFGLPQPLTRPCHLCHSALQGTSHQTETGEAVHAPHSHPTRHTPSGPNAGPPAYNPHRPVA